MNKKPFALIYLRDRDRSRNIQQLLDHSGVECQVASDLDDLYRQLNYRPVDVLVLENELEGFLTGTDVLKRVYADLLRPKSVLICRRDHETRSEAQELGVDALLANNCGDEEIANAASGLVATGAASKLFIPPGARRLVGSIKDFPPLPHVVMQLAIHLDEDDVSPDRIVDCISADPKLTADLLKLANSSAFGLQRKVSNVRDAVLYFGTRRSASLLVSKSLMGLQQSLGQDISHEQRIWCNYRSILTANIAEGFADQFERISGPTAYLLGLLQDLGIVIMLHAEQVRYGHILRRYRSIGQIRLDVIEAQEFGFQHAHVSAAVLQRWGLPNSMVSLILAHHDAPGKQDRPRLEKQFLRVMRLGESFSNLADGHLPQRFPMFRRALQHYNLTSQSEEIRAAMLRSIAKTTQSAEIFALPLPKDDSIRQLIDRLRGEGEKLDFRVEPSESVGESVPQAPERVEMSSPRPRVLILDDDPLVREVLSRTLADRGYDTIACATAAEARQNAAGSAAAFIDIHLSSVENGIDVVRALRSDGYAGKLIMVSGDRTRRTVGECVLAGADDYVAKPFDLDALLAKLDRHLQHAG